MNRKRNWRRRLLLSTGILLLLIGIPGGLTYLAARQERLNRALIAAVKRADAPAVDRLLEQGADANAPELPHPPPSWGRLLMERLRGRTNQLAFGTPIL